MGKFSPISWVFAAMLAIDYLVELFRPVIVCLAS